ncbi:MAG: helix-hairpin-helix domain-containing protein [Homoserinimonas sp.]
MVSPGTLDSLGNPRSLSMSKGAVVVLLLIAVAIAVLVSALGSHGSSAPVGAVRSSSAPLPVEPTIYVHLLGAVINPGLYELPPDARAVDAVAAAGGFAESADRAALNLARFLSDGEQLYVPAEGEEPLDRPGAIGTIAGKVNLNTADAATLETLPRVGPAMAARIIAWREANGRFTAPEDLKSVSGIGDKTFEAMRDLVTV